MECKTVVTKHGSKFPKLNGVEPDCPECAAHDSVLFLETWGELLDEGNRTGMSFECRACGCEFDVYFEGLIK